MADLDLDAIDPRKLSTEQFAQLLATARPGNMDLGEITPEAFAWIIKRASKEQVDAVLGETELRKPVLDEIFNRMCTQIRTERAERTTAVIHWNITGRPDGGTDTYETVIDAGTCTSTDSPTREPRTTLTMSGREFLNLVSGNASPPMQFITGKLKITGDLGFAAGLTNIFDIPKA